MWTVIKSQTQSTETWFKWCVWGVEMERIKQYQERGVAETVSLLDKNDQDILKDFSKKKGDLMSSTGKIKQFSPGQGILPSYFSPCIVVYQLSSLFCSWIATSRLMALCWLTLLQSLTFPTWLLSVWRTLLLLQLSLAMNWFAVLYFLKINVK